MIVEPSRQFRKALESSVYGVNAKLNGLARDPIDPEPRPIKAIRDWTTDDLAVRGEAGMDFPCLIMPRVAQFEMKGEQTTTIRDTETLGMRMAVALITEATMAKTAVGAVEAALIMRALLQSVTTWMSNLYAADRVSNNIQVRDALAIYWTLDVVIDEDFPAQAVAGGIFLDVMVRDLTPEG